MCDWTIKVLLLEIFQQNQLFLSFCLLFLNKKVIFFYICDFIRNKCDFCFQQKSLDLIEAVIFVKFEMLWRKWPFMIINKEMILGNLTFHTKIKTCDYTCNKVFFSWEDSFKLYLSSFTAAPEAAALWVFMNS